MKRTTNHGSSALIATRTPFQVNGGNMHGEAHTPGAYVSTGYLPRAYAERGAIRDADYIVYSYATPIAWHLADGWVVPDVSYSITTSSKHQGPARQGVHLSGEGLSPRHLRAPYELGLGPTAADILRAIRAGYAVVVGKRRPSTVQQVLDTGEAKLSDDGADILPADGSHLR